MIEKAESARRQPTSEPTPVDTWFRPWEARLGLWAKDLLDGVSERREGELLRARRRQRQREATWLWRRHFDGTDEPQFLPRHINRQFSRLCGCRRLARKVKLGSHAEFNHRPLVCELRRGVCPCQWRRAALGDGRGEAECEREAGGLRRRHDDWPHVSLMSELNVFGGANEGYRVDEGAPELGRGVHPPTARRRAFQ